jgi:serine/threonine protein kinase
MLLGAGSYGKVYAARWHGQDVAVKIIHCLPDELQRVLREAEIMLQLDHPNVSLKHTLAELLMPAQQQQLAAALQPAVAMRPSKGSMAVLHID